MKPAPFTYAAPPAVEEAIALLAAHGDTAKLLAGGQSVMPLMNLRLARPQYIIADRENKAHFARRVTCTPWRC